jgi:hypothetical protein
MNIHLYAQMQKVRLDSDTGNEMDDFYAIVRLLKVALFQAYLLTQFSEKLTLNSPPENKIFTVKIFSKIDSKAMMNDFWEVLKK